MTHNDFARVIRGYLKHFFGEDTTKWPEGMGGFIYELSAYLSNNSTNKDYFDLKEKVERLKSELAKEQAEKAYYIGYIEGVAEAFDEEAKARILEGIQNKED